MQRETKQAIDAKVKEEVEALKRDIQKTVVNAVDINKDVDGKSTSSPKSRAIRLLDLFRQAGYDPIPDIITALQALPLKERLAELRFFMRYMAPELEAQAISQQSPSDSLANAEQASKLLKSLEAKKP